jgi:hypothetical protein
MGLINSFVIEFLMGAYMIAIKTSFRGVSEYISLDKREILPAEKFAVKVVNVF